MSTKVKSKCTGFNETEFQADVYKYQRRGRLSNTFDSIARRPV